MLIDVSDDIFPSAVPPTLLERGAGAAVPLACSPGRGGGVARPTQPFPANTDEENNAAPPPLFFLAFIAERPLS